MARCGGNPPKSVSRFSQTRRRRYGLDGGNQAEVNGVDPDVDEGRIEGCEEAEARDDIAGRRFHVVDRLEERAFGASAHRHFRHPDLRYGWTIAVVWPIPKVFDAAFCYPPGIAHHSRGQPYFNVTGLGVRFFLLFAELEARDQICMGASLGRR